MVGNLQSDILKHAQHRTLANTAVLSFKRVLLRKVFDRQLEQFELIRHERVAVDEMLFVLVVFIRLGTVGEIEQGPEVVLFVDIDRFQRIFAVAVFLQQPFLNDFGNICTCQFHAIGKTSLNLRKVIGLLLFHIADDSVHVFLRGHDHPSLPFAFRG